ncbi:hypothetical protein I4U23_025643 [Adineta vaga]|nr:hypothetical protein I4U23_025643 [Adineta vaga]
MGDRRKLQGEIDRCLKKVTEGVETFDDIWQKVHSAPNHNQKDKYEQELKKEIKKLQRLRDQIKAWISSTEIKDKKQLQEARKNIELQMERFKIVERETKTKAYSKEGLGAGQKLDPQEKEKEECNQWIAEAIHELNIQIDKFEADIETLSASLKKKKSDKDKQERLEETKHSIERHKYHIESLEKILRAINNDALDPKTIQNLRPDIEYYVESNQDSDFKENDLMYEEIDMDDLTTLMAPVIVVPTTQSHPSSLSNGICSGLNSNATSNHIDISSSTNHLSDRVTTTTTTNSNHGDNESLMGLTTPSSTQASSPSASPALSLTDDRKRNKSESEDNPLQRNRTNSGTTNSSVTYVSSPKPSLQLQQQSPSLSSTTKSILPIVSTPASTLSTSAPPHFGYPPTTTTTSALPVLQYSAIVSQNTVPSTSTTTISSNTITSKQQQHVLSPPAKQQQQQQQSRQILNGNGTISTGNDSIVTTSLTLPISSVTTTITNSSNISHPPSLLSTTNDRSGVLSQHILNNISSQISTSLSTTSAIPSSLYSSTGSGLSNSNIPLESSPLPANIIDPAIVLQQPSILSRPTSENDRSTVMSNGSSDTHSLLDSTFSNMPSSSTSSLFLSNNNSNIGDIPTTNGGVIGQLANSIPINPEHHSQRFGLSSTSSNMAQQQTISSGRVPLTQAEVRMLNRLNSAYVKLPSLLESERQRTNANRIYGRGSLSQSQTVPYYPQTPPSGNDTPEFYYRLAPDTLFFVFYYMEGTRAQYLAAKALKRQSWRFHTKHMMWFQRHEEPKTITDDYEQGTYIFFDYERWQTRKRDNFIFEYKFLEDREF